VAPARPSGLPAKEPDRLRLPLTVSRPDLLVDGSDQLYRQLVHGLLSLAALHEAIRDGIAAHLGLGGVQHTILQSIRHLGASGSVGVREVADHLGFSGSFITVETAKLESMGLLEKKQSRTDRRKVSLVLTKKGVALFHRIAPLQQTIGDLQFGELSARQFRELAPVILQLVQTSREALFLLHHLKHRDAPHRMQEPNVETMRRLLKRHGGRTN
jgi:DNA-binding MarR family transcriptional regulator